mgnify:CR=1 FL=1
MDDSINNAGTLSQPLSKLLVVADLIQPFQLVDRLFEGQLLEQRQPSSPLEQHINCDPVINASLDDAPADRAPAVDGDPASLSVQEEKAGQPLKLVEPNHRFKKLSNRASR